jgi:hypothetical protein
VEKREEDRSKLNKELRSEYNQSLEEAKIEKVKKNLDKLKEVIKQKQHTVFEGINGIKHILHSIQKLDTANKVSSLQNDPMPEIVEIQFPEIIKMCSRITLVTEKKTSYITQYVQQMVNCKICPGLQSQVVHQDTGSKTISVNVVNFQKYDTITFEALLKIKQEFLYLKKKKKEEKIHNDYGNDEDMDDDEGSSLDQSMDDGDEGDDGEEGSETTGENAHHNDESKEIDDKMKNKPSTPPDEKGTNFDRLMNCAVDFIKDVIHPI